MAGSVFATMAQDRTLRRAVPLADTIAAEGYPYYTAASFTGTATANNNFATFMLPGITRAFWCEAVHISSNKTNVVQVGFSGNQVGSGYPSVVEAVTTPGGTIVVPVRQLLRPAHYASSGALGSATIKALIDTDATNTYIRAAMVGYKVTDDFNYGADKVMLWLGDSITADGTGPSAKTNQYDWRTLNYHKDAGRSVRMVNLSIGGSTSTQFERLRAHGNLDQPQVDHVYYTLGANDASQGVAAATYKANVAAAIAWKKSRYPKATMTVFGMTPQENDANEANAATLRTAASDAVTEAADAKVKFLDLGAAFDRKVAGNYATSDTAGSRIHPSDAGHASIWNVVKPFLDANPVLV